MQKLINKIKILLFKYKLFKPIKLADKILIVKYSNIEIYKLKNSSTNSFINENILIDIEHLENILKRDFSNEYVYELNLQNKETYIRTLKRWFSSNDRYVNNIDKIFITWLDLANRLNTVYAAGVKSVGSGKLYSNSIKAKPFINHIEIILDKILLGIRP